MDYEDVDRVINDIGFQSEPAFRDVTIAIRPIPDMNGCPLGLYYPESGTIVVPPDGYPSVLRHELGHRYGHYYNNDLSEQFAESFRRRYEGGSALMYAGSDFSRLPKMDRLFAEGEKGTLALWTDTRVSPEAVGMLSSYYTACSCGEPLPEISYGDNNISVKFTKGVDWLTITTAVLAAMTVAGVVAIAYALYKITKEAPWVFPVAIFGGFAGAILIGGLVARRVARTRFPIRA